MSATELEVVDLTPEAFSPFGTVGVPLGDGAHGAAMSRSICRRAGRGSTSCGWKGAASASTVWRGTTA
jgi:hypothetical protein